MNRFKSITLSSSFLVLALGVFAVPGTVSVAYAQDDDGAKKSIGIEEIIVTSRKREDAADDLTDDLSSAA
jgi:hypothetical protein